MTISITAEPIDVCNRAALQGETQLKMGDGTYVYITPELAAQWVGVLQTITTAEESA